MSAATREPARTAEVARHYLRLLGSERSVGVFLLVGGGDVLLSMNSYGFAGLPPLLWLMAMIPLAQWGIAELRDGLDEAMPLDRVRHDLVRVACGAAWAAAALAVAIGFLALLWYPQYRGSARVTLAWYPVLLLAAGATYYLLGAAAMLRGARRGFLPGAIAAIVFLPFLAPKSYMARGLLLLSLREAPASGELLSWTAIQALWTAAAIAAVWLSASAPRPAPLKARVAVGRWGAARARMRRQRGLLPVHAPRPARVDMPRRPAPLHRVLWREIVILRSSMAGMGALLLLVTLWANPTLDAIGANPAGAPWFLPIYCLSITWPIGVWLPLTAPLRRSVEPLPVGAVAQRLMRVAAGAVWLEVAVLLTLAGRAANVAGWIPRSASLAGESGPAAGIACCALLLYLLGSVPLLLAHTHTLGWTLTWLCGLLVAIPIAEGAAPHARFSFGAAMSAFGPQPGPWVGAMPLWIGIFAAVAAGAAAWGVRLERSAPSLEDATLALLRPGRPA